MKKQVSDLLAIQIKNWVLKNFGESEAEDPSWSIEALADSLADDAYLIYSTMEKAFLSEDAEYVAEQMGVSLTEEETRKVVDRFLNSDAYGACPVENWVYFINEVKKGK